MGSIINRAAAGLGAAALALGLGAAPATAAVAPAYAGSTVTADGTSAAAGHWQRHAPMSSGHSCWNAVLYFASQGIDAKCQVAADGRYWLFLWVDG